MIFSLSCAGNMYYTAMSNSARGFQRMWRRYWPPRKRRKLRGTIFVQVRHAS